jgi:hypothetical protein
MRLAFLLFLAAAAMPAQATDPKPEIERDAAAAQAVGVVHTLRQIPEACARIEGAFTGDASEPYRFAVVRTSASCQPRARFVDAAKAQPSEAGGWKLNDVISVPEAGCPDRKAVVRVWRKPVDQVQALDGQGRSRIYLEESRQAAAAGKIAAVPMYAAGMEVEGAGCGR